MAETAKDKSCCALGRRADIGAINAALRAGMGVREVAKTFGVGKSVVGEHRAECLRLDGATSKPRAVTAETRVEKGPREEVADSADTVRGQSGQVSGALRARLPTDPNDAKTFTEQSLVCADMIAAGRWEGRTTVRWLSALWGLSGEAVRARHQAGTVVAQADRGHIESERQVAIGALQEQERVALEAFEASKLILDEEGEQTFGAGDPKFLAIAQKARSEMARIAGCVPQAATTVNVNFAEDPKFREAARRFVDAVQDVLGASSSIVERLAARNVSVSVEAAAAVLAEAEAILCERFAPRPQLGEGS